MNCFRRFFGFRLIIAMAALLGVLLAGGCGGESEKEIAYGPPPSAQNVLLIVIEALPAYRLGCYGGDKSLTPNLDRLAKQGILFEQFHSAAPWTMPSFGTILSGVSPHLHKAGSYKSQKDDPSKLSTEMYGLNKNIPFLSEALGEVHTSIIVNNAFISKDYGFQRGWDYFDQRFAGFSGYRKAVATTQHALTILRQNSSNPHFMLLHYFDPHMPYIPEEPFRSKFGRGKQGRILMNDIVQLKNMRRKKFWPNKQEQQYLRGLHDAEIAYTDSQIGKLIDGMDSLNLLENTWIIVTADHGEELFEHGDFEHGHRFEEELTRVPLIIRPPRGAWYRGKKVNYAARHLDLSPTILTMFHKSIPEAMEGRDLLPMITGKDAAHRPTHMVFPLTGASEHAFFDGRYKIIQSFENNKIYMYDILKDPWEKKSVGTTHPEFLRMKKTIEATLEKYKALAKERAHEDDDHEISGDVLDSLRSLGYIE